MRILFLVNVDWFFISHRLPIAIAARERGHEVHLAGTFTRHAAELAAYGFTLHPITIARGGTHPLRELVTFLQIRRVLRRVAPDVLHAVTIKPVLYGGVLSRLSRIPRRVASVSGLGYVFLARGLRAAVLRSGVALLYRAALRGSRTTVIVQNRDDRRLLRRLGIARSSQIVLIPGSGISLDQYPPVPEPAGPLVVTMASRLLKDKGVGEFIAAARRVRGELSGVEFRLVGDLDPSNPASVREAEFARWNADGVVKRCGYRSDIATVFGESHIVVLPSYREGLPRVLCEAAACSRAVVTTDVPGCRDAIIPGRTGLAVPPRDTESLAAAIITLLNDPEKRRTMGAAGRRLAEERFDIRTVITRHIDLYESET